MEGSDPVETVRELWTAFTQGGVHAAIGLAPADVEWVPYSAGGRVLRGHEVIAWAEQSARSGERLEAHAYAFDRRGEHVLVSGHLRFAADRRDVHWVYFFSGGRLRRAESFPSREEALAAMEAAT
jgi:hypothetical protein